MKTWYIYHNNFNICQCPNQAKALRVMEAEAKRELSITGQGDLYVAGYIKMTVPEIGVLEAKLEDIK